MSYAQEREQDYIRKLREIAGELPQFCGVFFRGTESTTSAQTRHGYAVDLRTFFEFLTKNVERFKATSLVDFSLEDLNSLTALEIELFLEYVGLYMKNDAELANHENAKARKLSALRSLFKYLHRHNMVENNITTLVDTPKLHAKPIIRLEANEVADLLDTVDSGDKLSSKQKQYHEYTHFRDAALFSLFLGTGIRISELIGLDTDDFDFETNGFKVARKGGENMILYFSEEVSAALKRYIAHRGSLKLLPGHEKAMFLSIQGKRMCLRAVQNLVKKYAALAAPLKNISPHKLRSTYGTMLYQETGDIYLVADVLGHKDVNTTKRHYAAMTDENRRRAAKAVKLRED